MPSTINLNKSKHQFYTMDIHVHTSASADFQTPEATFLDILQRAESRGVNIISFTDHNTVAGYAAVVKEIDQLSLLATTNRILPDEKVRLSEYKRLFEKMLILPGFELTAMLGFHIIGLFSPSKSIREIEHLLIEVGVPPDKLDDGITTVGSTVDVIRAYQLINQAGGIVIAAHANSSNGVAMRGINFGGQTRIAYTQDKNLHALEVTDLEIKSPRSTLSFFNGTKPEYPRRMHCIQSSDSHRLNTDPIHKKNLGVGDRTTDVLLPSLSFESLKELFLANDFSKTRPHRHIEEPVFDYIQTAVEEGPSIVQSFHESIGLKFGKPNAVLNDICAFLNTNGGSIFIGVTPECSNNPPGVNNSAQIISFINKEVEDRISPPVKISIDTQKLRKKDVIQILVPRGDESPYALDENQIFIREETETNLAVRDEIVTLVERRLKKTNFKENQVITQTLETEPAIVPTNAKTATVITPKTGVEITDSTERGGKIFYSMRDLRNGNLVKNVTQASARRLWHYAISKYKTIDLIKIDNDVIWKGNFGLLSKYKQGQNDHFDFVLKNGSDYRFFFGVTLDGIDGEWRLFVDDE